MSNKKQSALSFRKKSCVIATEVALALMVAPVALAQQTATQQAATQKVEKLEITGSRIPSANLESPSPVATITAEDIKLEGVRNVESLLNNLPQVFADYGGQVSNGATGTATVNLRNLGSSRTLVLINGRRLPAGSPTIYATDLNQIPATLIRRVEVLTGGAGAVYGSDAVAGVVNFIMNDRFQGVQGEVNYGFYNHRQRNAEGMADLVGGRAATNPAQFNVPGNKSRDGEESEYNLTLGSNFANDRGNATFFLSYKTTEALLQSERDFSACALGTVPRFPRNCGGSSTAAPGRFLDLNTGASWTIANGSTPRRFNSALDQYNFGPLNYFQRPDERYTGAAYINYEVNPMAKVYGEINFADDRSLAQIAPSGSFLGGNDFRVSSENPLLSPAWRTALGITDPGSSTDIWLGRRNVEGGGRQADLRHTSFRGVLGVKGDLSQSWSYDAFFQNGQVSYQQTYLNDFSNVRLRRAMDVVVGPNGRPACRSFVDGTDLNCVPYNVWTIGGVTPEQLTYLQTPGLQNGSTYQQVYGATVTGDLGEYGLKAPAARSPMGVAFGVEQRVEKVLLRTDSAFESGDLAGQGGPTYGIEGKYSVTDLFGEVRLPIAEGKEWADRLNLKASYRYSDYSTGKKANTYGVGVEWAPVKQAMFRGSYQQAVRAANVIELFSVTGLGLYNNSEDPCAGDAPSRSLADCARTGVTASQYGNIIDSPAGQYNGLFGGNPDLKPEKSKSQTVGLVLTPTRDFSASVDYFNIKIDGRIGVLPPTQTLTLCLDTGSPEYCGLIRRDGQGTLWAGPSAFIVAPYRDFGKSRTSGVDVSASYTTKIKGYGSLNTTFVGTWLQRFESEDIPGVGSYDCAGLYGNNCGTPLPTWRHKVRATWGTPWNFDLSLAWRHMAAVKEDATSSNRLLAGTTNPADEKLEARNYLDLAASWPITKRIVLSGGINNLLDRDPPLTTIAGAPFGNGNTYPVVYDALGRRVFMTLTAKF